MPRFSIIVPVYNSEKYLDRCIRSIVTQTYGSFELLLINDGSTDRSVDICNTWEISDNRIHVFHQENRGASAARNIGINNARGEYIQFVDSDDTLFLNCLEILNDIISQYDLPDLIEFQLKYIGLNGYSNIQGTILEEGKYHKEFIRARFLPVIAKTEENSEIYYNIFNVLRIVKRSVIQEYNIRFDENIRRWEDWIFAIEAFLHSNEMIVVNQPLYNYYGHVGGGLGGKYDPHTYKYVVESYNKLQKILGNMYDLETPYALDEKKKIILRCMQEIVFNEGYKDRKRLLLEIVQDSFFENAVNQNKTGRIWLIIKWFLGHKYYTEIVYLVSIMFNVVKMGCFCKSILRQPYYRYIRRDTDI